LRAFANSTIFEVGLFGFSLNDRTTTCWTFLPFYEPSF
jgi:hypothetical protein